MEEERKEKKGRQEGENRERERNERGGDKEGQGFISTAILQESPTVSHRIKTELDPDI